MLVDTYCSETDKRTGQMSMANSSASAYTFEVEKQNLEMEKSPEQIRLSVMLNTGNLTKNKVC
jgi:hypothetical protein